MILLSAFSRLQNILYSILYKYMNINLL